MSADDELGVLTSFTSTCLIHLLLSVGDYSKRTLRKLEQSEKRSVTGQADTREAPAARLELAPFL